MKKSVGRINVIWQARGALCVRVGLTSADAQQRVPTIEIFHTSRSGEKCQGVVRPAFSYAYNSRIEGSQTALS